MWKHYKYGTHSSRLQGLSYGGLVPNDMDALAAMIPTLEFEYFIFLLHALGIWLVQLLQV